MKLIAILVIGFFLYKHVSWLINGEMLLPGGGGYASRSEQPRAYWAYLFIYAIGSAVFGYLLWRRAFH